MQDKLISIIVILDLGAPLGEEQLLPDGGAKQYFELGAIYFHPRVGAAFECHGLILQTYIESGEERSSLGYPITDEIDNPDVPDGKMSIFEFGRPEGFNTDPLVAALNQGMGIVEYAYTSPVLEDPAVVGTSNPRFIDQGYLGNINGINVQAAWAHGADGSGTELIDIERGWLLTHRDLPQNIPLLDGHNFREGFPHGCAVLGVIVGVDDNKGIVGIAPKAGAAVISRVNRRGAHLLTDQTAAMILKATILLGFGDVLLLEMTAAGRPVEILPAMFDAIKLATSCGVIVVEPAGNGGANLDDFRDDSGKRVLSRIEPTAFKESRAIVVAASRSSFPHTRLSFSSFGSRVDCYAWGENIVTTGNEFQDTDPNAYMDNFRGTSGASAIIAGVCLLIQDLQSRLIPVSGLVGKLGPFALRQMISNPQNGTQPLFEQDRIGILPDFKKILANEYIELG